MPRFRTLAILMLISLIVLPSHVVHSSSVIKQNQANQISSFHLNLTKTQVELGNSLSVNYGVLDNNSQFLGNISYYILLFDPNQPVDNQSIADGNYTLLSQGKTKDSESQLVIETLLVGGKQLVSGNYQIFASTNETTAPNVNSTVEFEVFRKDGATIEIQFLDQQNNLLVSPVNLTRNESKTIQITLSNTGSANALNVAFTLEGINNPLQIESTGLSDGLTIQSLSPDGKISANMTVTAPDFGIASLEFSLVYSRMSGQKLEEAPTLEFHILPRIRGSIDVQGIPMVGQSLPIEVIIQNNEQETFKVRFYLSSEKFIFSPTETQDITLKSGLSVFDFTGITSVNGTFKIDLFMIYFDPLGNDQYHSKLNSLSVDVTKEQGSNLTPFQIILLVLLSLILLFGITFVVSKSFREFFVTQIVRNTFVPDLKFNKKIAIVDGSNVAWEQLDREGKPQIENIKLAVKTLNKYGFEKVIVVADAALRYQIKDSNDLDHQAKIGKIKVLPAKVDGDSFILRLSRDIGGLILTNDLYREYREEFPWIDKRRIPYSILESKFYLHPIYDLD